MDYNTHSNVSPSSLKVHEWLAITIAIATLASLALVTKVHGSRLENQLQFHAKNLHDSFDVLVKGAVDFPGIYHLHSGMQMKDILAMAGVKDNADLRRYAMEGWVKKGRAIHVPVRQMVTVHLEGAIKGNPVIKIPKGSKVCDLLNVVALADDADIEVLQKKRVIKDNEIIVIPTIK